MNIVVQEMQVLESCSSINDSTIEIVSDSDQMNSKTREATLYKNKNWHC